MDAADAELIRDLANWNADTDKRIAALAIALGRMVAEIEALAPGAHRRVYATAIPDEGVRADIADQISDHLAFFSQLSPLR